MKAQEILNLLKASVITVAKNDGPLPDAMKQKLANQAEIVKQGLESLSEKDRTWVEEEYKKWFKDELVTSLPPIKRRAAEFLMQTV